MKHDSRKLLAFPLILVVLLSCAKNANDTISAKKTVEHYFADYFERPFGIGHDRENLYHKDYWNVPGVEGTKISLIDRHVEIVEVIKYIGDKTLYKVRTEDLIRIVARMRQHYFINGVEARKEDRSFGVTFYLSKYQTNNGKYLIINYSPLEYDIYYEDSMRKYLNSTKNSIQYSRLRDALVAAGMLGLF